MDHWIYNVCGMLKCLITSDPKYSFTAHSQLNNLARDIWFIRTQTNSIHVLKVLEYN